MNDALNQSIQFTSLSESDTQSLGKALGNALIPGITIGLNGTLGAGKTRLTQAIGKSLGIANGNVVSPTFTICVPHEGRLPFLHLDAYRIQHPEEVDELGLDEMTEDGVVLIVEWASLIESLLPPIDIEISITSEGSESRLFRITGITDRGQDVIKKTFKTLNSDS